MRKPIIAGNWKMFKTLPEAKSFLEEVKKAVPAKEEVESVVCSPALFLESLVNIAKGTNVGVGAQNMHFEESGAFTGEISPLALEDLGVQYVIIGHSERREMFNESDEAVNKKALAAFKHGIIPIVCCGETLEQRESGITNEFVGGQVQKALAGLTEEQAKQVVIAYEPIWAIGTGLTAKPEEAQEVHAMIRQQLAKHDAAVAEKVQILYGGSVKADNAKGLFAMPDIDGGLVGGASLEAKGFLAICEAAM